jgi:hypothetical protein
MKWENKYQLVMVQNNDRRVIINIKILTHSSVSNMGYYPVEDRLELWGDRHVIKTVC